MFCFLMDSEFERSEFEPPLYKDNLLTSLELEYEASLFLQDNLT